MGAENITRVLRAKVKGLQDEIKALQAGCTKRVSQNNLHTFTRVCRLLITY
jgi:hypothetical protein